MQGKTVVVTGCASGIGAAVVEKLHGMGAGVIGVDRQAADHPGIVQMIKGDLSTRKGVEEIAEQVPAGVDVLVNNAGVAANLPWRTVLSINALAPRDLSRLLIPKLNRNPAVVTTASQAGFMWSMNFERLQKFLGTEDWDEALDQFADSPGIEAQCYNLSKEAAIINSGNLAVSPKHLHLRSNTVSPGTVATPLLPSFRDTMGAEMIDGAATWAGRHAKPEEIANTICWLASDEASWVSGADVPVDGGFSPFVWRTYVAPAMAAMAGGANPQPETAQQGAVDEVLEPAESSATPTAESSAPETAAAEQA